MADQTLLDFFSGPVMTQLANSPTIKAGVPQILAAGFRKPSPSKTVGTHVKYKKFNGDRSMPPLIHQQSSSQTQSVPGSQWEQIAALGTSMNFPIGQEMLYAITSNLPYVQANAMDELRKNLSDFNRKAETLRESCINSMVLTGHIYAGTNVAGSIGGGSPQAYVGNFLQNTTTNAPIQVLSGGTGPSTFGTGTSWTNTSTAAGDWATITTDIPGSLRAMRQGYLKTSNYMPSMILYGKNIPSYLALNTECQTYMSRSGQSTGLEFQMTNEVPKGFLDFNWFPAYNAYYVDPAGNPQTWLGDDSIVILPDISEDWYEFVEAGTLVPNAFATGSDSIETMMTNYRPVFGRYSYATMTVDPVNLKGIIGDYFFPAIKSNLVQWIATVH